MSIVIIINPVAGARGRTRSVGHRVELARAIAHDHGEVVDVFVTEATGHARELAQAARRTGARLVVAWGGDGTVNEIASALAFGEVCVGIVAEGSGNGLAHALGVPRRPAEALNRAIRAAPRTIDVGEVDDRLFVNVAGIGLDAHVAELFNAPENKWRGYAGYVAATARALLSHRGQRYRLTTPAGEQTVHARMITLANGAEFGNGIRIAPRARVDDGLLDLVVVEEVSPLNTVWNVRWVLLGAVDRSPIWSSRPVVEVVIESERSMSFHVDGELARGGTRIAARIRPRGLRVCA